MTQAALERFARELPAGEVLLLRGTRQTATPFVQTQLDQLGTDPAADVACLQVWGADGGGGIEIFFYSEQRIKGILVRDITDEGT